MVNDEEVSLDSLQNVNRHREVTLRRFHAEVSITGKTVFEKNRINEDEKT